MSRQNSNGRGGRFAMKVLRAAFPTLVVALSVAATKVEAQESEGRRPADAAPSAPATGVAVVGPAMADGGPPVTTAPAAEAADGANGPAVPILPPDIQVVRFQGPEGLAVEVLAPAPSPVPPGEGAGILTVGLKRGVGYRLRISNIPERPGVEVFPVVEVVGHLHRPEGINPGKYPIRVIFTMDDLDSVVQQGRLVTKVIYLEDPDQALPLRMTKDQIPVVSLNPTEHPLRVASALGRPMAIVRIGGRRPTIEEVNAGATGDIGMDWAAGIGTGPCPFIRQDGTRCPMPSGPKCTAPAAPSQPPLPRDEFLCDGGDRGIPVTIGSDGRLGGVEPRDAVVRFDIGLGDRITPRILPTNVVCVYAPRFAEVRVTTGTNETVDVQGPRSGTSIETPLLARNLAESRRVVQNQSPELARNRARASGMKGRNWIDEESNNRAAGGFENVTQLSSNLQKQHLELARNRQKAGLMKEKIRLEGIKTATPPVVTGVVEGAGETVKVWGPHAMTGVETPPDRPGLAVIKRVSAVEAEPGDTLTYVIFYRNMGNTPIRSVTIADSLLPRLEYVKGTSRGPEGTIFTTAVNRVGSTEMRWTLPGTIAPGTMGHVSFEVIVR
jgi:uncharacterized repeat protein (TIGR01451 family)